MFEAQQFCEDYGLAYSLRHKHVTRGWVGIPCPFCSGNPGYHGGFNPRKGYYSCWRCGGHWLPKVISTLLAVSISSARIIETRYTTGDPSAEAEQAISSADACVRPEGSGPLGDRAWTYLQGRDFEPGELEAEWGLQDTGTSGRYKFRIIAPITYGGRLVSYQGRDYTDQQMEKYKACMLAHEVVHHKNILYGIDRAPAGGSAVAVEGVTDVWRLGPGAVGVFGIEWTVAQAMLAGRRWKRLFVLFDNEELAQEQAEEFFRAAASFRADLDGEIIRLPGIKDPGDLKPGDAKYLMRQLGL